LTWPDRQDKAPKARCPNNSDRTALAELFGIDLHRRSVSSIAPKSLDHLGGLPGPAQGNGVSQPSDDGPGLEGLLYHSFPFGYTRPTLPTLPPLDLSIFGGSVSLYPEGKIKNFEADLFESE
jgi:hypothetical protein